MEPPAGIAPATFPFKAGRLYNWATGVLNGAPGDSCSHTNCPGKSRMPVCCGFERVKW